MGERGCDEEGEDEGRERPERPVKVGRGREVGGSVGRRQGVECVDTAKDDLVVFQFSGLTTERKNGGRKKKPTVLVSMSKWC